jgi:predicted metallo-beta-lactamase superfamily hydrolase
MKAVLVTVEYLGVISQALFLVHQDVNAGWW